MDGDFALPLATAQDHKQVFDGDKGPNTGGMGAYSPAPVMTEALVEAVMDRIIRPTVAGMKAEGRPFKGVLFAGLMITEEGPQLIEYNVRFGDPECQVDPDAPDVRPAAGLDRRQRRRALQLRSALVRGSGADRGAGRRGLSRLLREGHGDQGP